MVYNRLLSQDTKNGRVNISDLKAELSGVGPELNFISTEEDTLSLNFMSALSAAEEAVMDSVLAAHEGTPKSEDPAIQQVTIEQQPAFASKNVGDKKIYKRVHGQQFSVTPGTNTLEFSVPYSHAKITGVEFINASIGDSASLLVCDNSSGTYSGVADYCLNQFGYNVYISPQYHEEISNYDADLYISMVIKVDYYTSETKNVYVNYVLHEVK